MGTGARCGIALLASTATGCAFTFTETVSDSYHESQTPRCTASRGFVATDGFFAASFGLVAVIFASADDSYYNDEADSIVATFGVVALAFATSAVIGTSSNNRCREAFDRHDAWLAATSRALEPAPATPAIGPPGTTPRRATPALRVPEPVNRAGPDGQQCDHRRSSVASVNGLHGRAAAAARKGRCDAVSDFAAAIRHRDSNYYLHVFRCDVRIWKVCALPSP